MIVRELVAKLGFDVDNQAIRTFDASISTAKKSVEGLQNNIDRLGTSVRNVGSKLSLFITAPLTLLGATMIKSASDAEETAQRFNVVFRDIRKDADAVASSFGKDFGVARDESKKLLGTTGDLLTGFEFSQEASLDLANKVARLGADIASFNNIQGGADEAITRLTKGILGETENLKLLSIVVNQGTKEFKQQVEEIRKSRGVTLQQAKSLAIFSAATKQSKNAIGDFARTSNSFANRLRIFRSRIRDVTVSFGKLLLPTANKVLGVFIKIAELFDKLPKFIKVILLSIGSFVAVLGPLLFILGSLITSFGFFIVKILILKRILAFFSLTTLGALVKILKTIFQIFSRFSLSGIVLKIFSRAMLAVIIASSKFIAIALLISSAIGLIIDDFDTWMQKGDSVLGALLGNFEDWKTAITGILQSVKRIFSSLWTAMLSNSEADWDQFIIAIVSAANGLVEKINKMMERFGVAGDKSLEGFNRLADGITNLFLRLVGFLGSRAIGLGNAVGRALVDGILSGAKEHLSLSGFGKFIGKAVLPEFFEDRDVLEKRNEEVRKTAGAIGNALQNFFLPTFSGSSPGNATTGLNSTAVNSSNQTIFENNIDIQVPPGTQDQQVQFLKTTADAVFNEQFNRKMSESIFATPKSEK